MGCCTTRMKADELSTSLHDFHAVNTLPTYENMLTVYTELHLPLVNPHMLSHRKEQMVFMIVNMIRT
jgi:hypothetical protein